MHRFVRALAAVAGSLLTAATLAAPGTAAGTAVAPAVTFDVSLGSPCFLVEGPPRTRGTVTIRTPGGRIRGQIDVRTERDGQVSDCIFGIFTGINGGDSITFRSGDLRVRWTIPRIGLSADRDADTYTVTGPTGAVISVTGIRGQVLGRLHTLFGADEVTLDGDGRVTRSPGVDLVGADWLMADLEVGGNSVLAAAFVPFISVQDGDRVVSGAVEPGSPLRVKLARDGRVLADITTSELVTGQYIATLAGRGGDPVYVRAGDRITVTGAGRQTMKMPLMRLAGDPVSDTLTGHCFPGAGYRLEAEAPFFSDRDLFVTLFGRTGPDGSLTRQLKRDLRLGDELRLVCQNANGDVAEVRRVVPR